MTNRLCRCGEIEDAVHVAHVTVQVHRHDGFGSAIHQSRGGLNADAVVIQVYIGKARNGAGLQDRKAGGNEGVTWHNDLIARTDPQCGESF